MISLKHEIKSRIRKLFYKNLVQNFLCSIIFFYMELVYKTSKKTFINYETLQNRINSNQRIILPTWHGRIMMAPFITRNIKNKKSRNNFLILASAHNDGKFVSKIMSKFGFHNVTVSSKSKQSIGSGGLREILKSIKSGMNFVITPDGPRGPKQKNKGQLVNIARISGAPIMPFSYSCSKNIRLNSWDEFIIPLPFSKLCYCFGDLIWVDKNASEEETVRLNLVIEDEINLTMKKADEVVRYVTN